MSKSNRKRRSSKAPIDRPEKPYPEFPLGAANNGYWQKKIGGKIRYFGHWGKIVHGKMVRLPEDGWKEALELYKSQIDDLQAGRKPRAEAEGLTVGELRARFLSVKSRALDNGELTARTYFEYRATADRLLALFGENRLVSDLASDDFETLRAGIAKQWGPIRLGNEIQRVRTLFKYGYESGLIDVPVRFGPTFKKPSRSVMRKHRATNGKRLFEAAEIRALLDAASPQLKAMTLLGINCGFGNGDVASLPRRALDLKKGWVDFPRPKTGIGRRCPLWPETVTALKAATAERPDPKDKGDAELVFITKYGHRWVRVQGEKHVPIDAVLQEFCKILPKPHGRGIGFYGLRHTFRTIADATKDFPAIRLIMGHADGSIDDAYREGIEDSRLKAVADYVRAWLFPKKNKK